MTDEKLELQVLIEPVFYEMFMHMKKLGFHENANWFKGQFIHQFSIEQKQKIQTMKD